MSALSLEVVRRAAPVAAAPAPGRNDGVADCRDYQTTVTIDGKPQTLIGTVCKGPDGDWRTVR